VFPRHPSEIDRLDIQHYALREAFGANYLAPIQRPAWVLDVGCGSGQWAFDLCSEFPKALAVGLDLVPSKPEHPENYRFVKSNLLDGLPFPDDRFEFVHQRLLGSGVPLKSWDTVVEDLVRVARPGGWIELVEGRWEIEPAGPATKRLFELGRRVGQSLGLDMTGIVFGSFDERLQGAGMINIERWGVDVPIGEWGGRLGSLMATDCRAMFTRLSTVFKTKLHLSRAECNELLQAMTYECEEHNSMGTFACTFGQKPL
jgi:SAM-dependent methyltransferase